MTDKITDTKKIPVLMDCDPGADDVFALLWILIAHQSPHTAIDLKALTTLGGNVAAEFTYLNALRMKEFV